MAFSIGADTEVEGAEENCMPKYNRAHCIDRKSALSPELHQQLLELSGDLRAAASSATSPSLRARLRRIADGIARVGMAEPRQAPVSAGQKPANLTPREVDVLHLVSLGHTNAAIADALGITPETVKSYLRSVGTKLDTSSRYESVIVARSQGLPLWAQPNIT